MAIQILVMTDDPSTIQGVLHALEDRRTRVLVHPLDKSLLVVAREASPAAILLDASDSAERAARVKQAIEDDGGFSAVPIFALGAEMEGVTSSYEDVESASSIAAEILAIAELTFGFQGGDDAGLFESLDDEMDFASTLGPAGQGSKPSAPPVPPRGAPPALPPLPGTAARRESMPGIRRESIPGVPMPTRNQAKQTAAPKEGAAPAAASPRRARATGAMPVVEGSGRETLNLKQDLLVKDREILTLRSQVMDLEEQHLEKDETNLHSLERLAAMEAQLVDFEDQLDERQTENDRLAKMLDEATRTQEAEREEAQESLQTAQQERDALQTALEEERAQLQEQLAEASKRDDLQAQITTLAEENDALNEQRDELLAITAELESAMNEADLQAASYAERFEKADTLVDVLRTDLGVYVEAAHRVVEERETQSATLADLATQLEAALEATRGAATTTDEALPATNWEAAYNAYLESSQAANGEGGDEELDTELDADLSEEDGDA